MVRLQSVRNAIGSHRQHQAQLQRRIAEGLVQTAPGLVLPVVVPYRRHILADPERHRTAFYQCAVILPPVNDLAFVVVLALAHRSRLVTGPRSPYLLAPCRGYTNTVNMVSAI